jgi:hypothetical protein
VTVGEEVGPPPVHWIAVILAAILTAGVAFAFRGAARAGSPVRARPTREDLLLEVARLDDDYQRETAPSEAVTKAYQARRAELIRRLRGA